MWYQPKFVIDKNSTPDIHSNSSDKLLKRVVKQATKRNNDWLFTKYVVTNL